MLLALAEVNKGQALFCTFDNIQQPDETGGPEMPCSIPASWHSLWSIASASLSNPESGI